jgi:transposase
LRRSAARFFVQGKPIKAICRELRISRKVVRKVLRSEATEFRYEREAQGKASRERLTLIRLFEELRGLGYDGGYDAVRRYAREWNKERGASTAAAYVPLIFAPGEAYQFDWSHEVVLLSGVTVIVKAVLLCHSRMLFVRAYPARRRRWCSTPTTGRLPYSRVRASAASTTT